MKQPNLIAPSILSANFTQLGQEINTVLKAGADIIHFDVMDNHYVPNLTIGPMICQSLRDNDITAPIDVHLMTKPVDQLITEFAKAGANYISFHPEATEHIDRSIELIKSYGIQVGLAFNPSTPLSYLDYTIDKLDIILLMSVNPGFGGQSFIPNTLSKIKQVRQIIDDNNLTCRLEIDGGVNIDNIKQISNAGADTFVAGSAIFKSDNYQTTITTLRQLLI